MKILITGTAGFIGFHLAKKLLERGDEVVGVDNINDYYDVNLKYARLAELGIFSPLSHEQVRGTKEESTLGTANSFVVNLAAQAGVRYSIENPHAYIQSNVVSFSKRIAAC
ncbi:MAG: GDP-mannose 4,6-dehydratase [Campylobacteraceae bacterium]|nr:GDP-mannose 4,6-dehydratase [Campylobacteraceae bacterium]